MGSAGMEFQLITQDISRTRVDGAWFFPGLPGIFYQCFFGGPNASSLVGSLGICCLPRHFMKLIGHFIAIFPPVSVESKFQNLIGYWVVPKASRTRTSNDFFWTNHSKIRIKRFIKWSGGWGLDTHAHLTVYLCHEKKCARFIHHFQAGSWEYLHTCRSSFIHFSHLTLNITNMFVHTFM